MNEMSIEEQQWREYVYPTEEEHATVVVTVGEGDLTEILTVAGVPGAE